ncbi:MAG: hypothetical protein ACLR5X_00795 [Oscillospiraceae bacterium]
MKAKKALALILVLVMVLGLLTVTASADTAGSLGSPTNGIKSITISGANINNNEDRTLTGSSAPYNLTYNVKLASGTADGTVVTATFEKENASNENLVVSSAKPNSILNAVSRKHIKKHASLTYNATVQNGTATMTVYVYPNLADSVKSYGTYVINFQLAEVNNPITVNGTQIRFGDPAYPMTEPERYMSFEAAGTNAYNAVYAGPTAGFVPDLYSLYLKSDAALTLTSNSTDIVFRTYDANGNMTETNTVTGTSGTGYFSTVIYVKAAGSIQVATAGSTTATTINFSAPNDPSSAHDAQLHPDGAIAYLPGITQYANRGDWGSISTGGDNLLTPATKVKGYKGFAANGFSLGSLGGYVQYDFSSNPIQNLDTNPYGVDFVVYGNAFNGNPEAAAVQVYAQEVLSDGTLGDYKWYELAGSMYYSDSAVRNATVYYTKDNAGLHAAVNGVTHSQDPFTTAATWFPTKSDMNHEATSGINNTLTNTYITEYTANTLKFAGITSIPDSDSNADYAFGYADVTPVPSVKDGTPVNPYTPYTSDKDGGDGFDLAWAVDISTGEPVKVNNAKYVRIYSAVLYNTGIFGETSPEITGIFRTNGTVTAATTATPTVKVNGQTVTPAVAGEEIPVVTGTTDEEALISVVATDSSHVFINDAIANEHSFTFTEDETLIRVIVQDDSTAAPVYWLY